jgi:site-specific recombinase XerD
VLRSLLRYLAEEGHIAAGWDAALPPVSSPRNAQLPRSLSEGQVRALWKTSEGMSRRALRNRALLSLFLGLGLRT